MGVPGAMNAAPSLRRCDSTSWAIAAAPSAPSTGSPTTTTSRTASICGGRSTVTAMPMSIAAAKSTIQRMPSSSTRVESTPAVGVAGGVPGGAVPKPIPTWRLAGIGFPSTIASPPAWRTRTTNAAGSARATAGRPALPSTIAGSGNAGAPDAFVGVSACRVQIARVGPTSFSSCAHAWSPGVPDRTLVQYRFPAAISLRVRRGS